MNSRRRIYAAITAAAFATAIFTGCTPSEPSVPSNTNVPVTPPSSSSSASVTSSSSSSSDVPGTPSGSADSEGIKFKFWYENNKPSESTSTAGTATGDTLFGSDSLPIYEDADGKKYVGSDFKHISVTEDGSISKDDVALLRDSEDYKIYLVDSKLVLKEGFKMPAYDQLSTADFVEGSIRTEFENASVAILYVNGILAGEVEFRSQIDINDIFSVAANIGAINFKDNKAIVSFGTAVDVITATFTPKADGDLVVTYDTTGETITISSHDVSYNFSSTTDKGNYLRLDPEYIEKALGYHIIGTTAADGTLELNVITDTKDEVKEGNTVLTDDAAEHITNADIPAAPDNTSNSSAPDDTSKPVESNPKPTESKPVEPKPTESTPAQTPTSNPVESTPAQTTPVQSTPTQSSSTPTTPSTPKPTGQTTASGDPIIKGKYTGYTPDDTTGITLDANGHPADAWAWLREKSSSFVDSSGQLWNYTPGIGWQKATPGGVTDRSDYVDPDLPNIKPGH